MKRNNWLLLLLLVIIVGYALYAYWPFIFKPGIGVTPIVQPAVPIPVTEENSGEVSATQELKLSKEMNLINPFARRIAVLSKAEIDASKSQAPAQPQPGEVKIKTPHLEGIWVDSGMRVAFISGQTLSVGGQVLGWKVTKILKDSVVLLKDGNYKVLKMEAAR
jgi:hypothetical protein